MTIYHYVPNKDALRTRVVNHILSQIRIPGPNEGDWEERLRQLERQARRVFTEHPGVAGQLREAEFAEANRLAEGVLEILREGGFSPKAAVLCFATLYTFMTGQIDLDAMAGAMARTPSLAALDGVSRGTAPSADELFEFGFDAVVEGLKLKLMNRPASRRRN